MPAIVFDYNFVCLWDGLSAELQDEIIGYLSLRELHLLCQSEDRENLARDHLFRRVQAYLGEWGLEIKSTLSVMGATNTVLSGSVGTAVVQGDLDWHPNDLDFYTVREGLESFCEHLQEQGYKQHLMKEKDYGEMREDGQEGVGLDFLGFRRYVHGGLDRVLTFRNENAKKINVVVSCSASPFVPILYFHSTVVMNVITADGVGCFYPDTIRSRIGIVNTGMAVSGQPTMFERREKALNKYRDRGYYFINACDDVSAKIRHLTQEDVLSHRSRKLGPQMELPPWQTQYRLRVEAPGWGNDLDHDLSIGSKIHQVLKRAKKNMLVTGSPYPCRSLFLSWFIYGRRGVLRTPEQISWRLSMITGKGIVWKKWTSNERPVEDMHLDAVVVCTTLTMGYAVPATPEVSAIRLSSNPNLVVPFSWSISPNLRCWRIHIESPWLLNTRTRLALFIDDVAVMHVGLNLCVYQVPCVEGTPRHSGYYFNVFHAFGDNLRQELQKKPACSTTLTIVQTLQPYSKASDKVFALVYELSLPVHGLGLADDGNVAPQSRPMAHGTAFSVQGDSSSSRPDSGRETGAPRFPPHEKLRLSYLMASPMT
ncbi:hypothetical protein CC1G_01475 [Coprinopsis cinerea okayama7|uniref:Uncharacterized protein n=1 Tax=Coprinopsis cinerea (strain Okayama-7 / 130 / ATCC MYA-4618 / FGSC 9003) TaxID=240176 RepID=A8NYZ0_COPC7|nr:hypothetical protein CC1G_01475 [Coprinopsis cinerea okayama7\|eukprot:XP_001837563.2 hypothetical protein CC1G_01475 [Coprinopsis cinerea okayama7\